MKLRRALAVLLAALAALCPVSSVSHASAPFAAASAHGYDASSIARVHVQEVGDAEVSPAQLKDAPEVSASPSVGVPGASTTPSSRSVATESVSTLFRGTTEGYSGSPGLQRVGVTPASTDPAVATAFGIHGEEFGSGVVHIASPADLAGAKLYPPSLGGLEAEVGVGMTPAEFASSAGTSIPAGQARGILAQMGVSVPGQLPTVSSLNSWLAGRTPMTPAQITEFIRRAGGG